MIADHVRLVLAPTRQISGKVDLGGLPHTGVYVECLDADDPTGGRYQIVAPVGSDGSFVLAGATQGAVRVAVATKRIGTMNTRVALQSRAASPAPITDIRLALSASERIVDIVVHSAVATPLEGASVLVVPGRHQIPRGMSAFQVQATGFLTGLAKPPVGDDLPPRVLAELRPGDLVAHINHVFPGTLTICAEAFTSELLDMNAWRRMRNVYSAPNRCEQIGPDTSVVVVSVPAPLHMD